jgi:hypothetical protein
VVDTLLDEEFLAFTPETGVFDMEAVAQEITKLGFWFRDESDPARFVVTADEESRDEFQRRRREDPESPFPYVLLINAAPERIIVSPSTFDDEKPMTRAFIEWLRATYPCQIKNEYGLALDADGGN